MIRKETFLPWWYLEKKNKYKIIRQLIIFSIVLILLIISFSINIYLKNQLTKFDINHDDLIKNKKNKYIIYKDNLDTNLRELQIFNELFNIAQNEHQLQINVSGKNVLMDFYSNDPLKAKDILVNVEKMFKINYYNLNEIDEKIHTELKMVIK
ncbi:hypothetical protein [Clostridium grantii]|uniref:Uncharacterized protein n=1 Tax=Clostridium grantii DSM 8605 TaxID=1121316 RepID=A0A1M5SFS8_9CLOT|nr:hypothetical protein [Clostridium grantii]SHH37447.1 hypothetical protein SAMN02745207_00918 [Clostridium grantii DSM 8605]